MADPSKDDIIALEKDYWEAKDGQRTAQLSGGCSALITGARGVMSVPKAKMKAMTEEGNWTLESVRV